MRYIASALVVFVLAVAVSVLWWMRSSVAHSPVAPSSAESERDTPMVRPVTAASSNDMIETVVAVRATTRPPVPQRGPCANCPSSDTPTDRRDSLTPTADEQSTPGNEWLPPPLPQEGVFFFSLMGEPVQQVGTWTRRDGALTLSTDRQLHPLLETAKTEMAMWIERLGKLQRVGNTVDGYDVLIAGPRRVAFRHTSGMDVLEAVFADGRLKQMQRVHLETPGSRNASWNLVLQPR